MLLQARCDDPLTQLSVQYHMIWGITVRNLAVAIIKVMYVSIYPLLSFSRSLETKYRTNGFDKR